MKTAGTANIGDRYDAQIRSLHAEGMSDAKIAKRLGVSRVWANTRRRKLGLQSNDPRRKRGPSTTTLRYTLGDESYLLTAPPKVVEAAKRALARVELVTT